MLIRCGIDEVGRGPLAGPVTAAAVVLPAGFPLDILNDSKRLTPLKREKTLSFMLLNNIPIGIGWSWPEEIDRINIHNATLTAMKRAFDNLNVRCDEIIIDGIHLPESLPVPAKAVIKADASVPEVMAASIAAKVIRDRWMTRYSWIEPGYGYDKHKGYPTREHREACLKLGASPIQRNSFKVRA